MYYKNGDNYNYTVTLIFVANKVLQNYGLLLKWKKNLKLPIYFNYYYFEKYNLLYNSIIKYLCQNFKLKQTFFFCTC